MHTSPLAFKKCLLLITAIAAGIACCFTACQKDLSGVANGVIQLPPDLSSKINSSVSGFVTDETDEAVEGTVISAGGKTMLTDKFGYFEIRNIPVVKEAAVVTVAMPGYFKGIKTWMATENKAAFFRIKLLPKTAVANIDAAAGGKASLSSGFSITLPAGAVVNAGTGAAYTGQVSVAAQWINPADDELYKIMPGDLRGVNKENILKLLTTYGMCAAELTGDAGEMLQVAPGKKASLNFPIPSSLTGAAPASIPLWYFDEQKGLWKEEGSAIKTGNNYTGDVSHFSYWNCDIPLDNAVSFDITVKDAAGNPISAANVLVKYASGAYTGAHGLTDSAGYINGKIPGNAQLIIDVFTDYNFGCPVYTQNITTTTADISLGTVTITASNTAIISGSITDCNNAPVTDGYAIAQISNNNYKANVRPDGTFSLNVLLCAGSSSSVNIIAVDNVSQQQSTPLTMVITSGENATGVLKACGVTTEEFINYTINSTDYSIAAPAATFGQDGSSTNGQYISGYPSNSPNRGVSFYFSGAGIGAGSSQNLIQFSAPEINDSTSILTPITVNITEYGAVGEFIAGNFTGTFTGGAPANTPYVVTCSFRTRRKS